MEDILHMSNREIDRLKVIQNVMNNKIKQIQAGRWLRLSTRQIRRLVRRVQKEGNRGIIHKARGRISNNFFPADLKEKTLNYIHKKYADFGPTLIQEYLAKEKEKIRVSRETIRHWMISEGLYTPRKRKPLHRAWRSRRICRGELVQLDGSIHDWFENRGPRCVLIAYIDDATSELLFAQFVPAEDTFHLFQTTKIFLQRQGRPLAFYVDRDSIYRVNRQASVEEELQDIRPLTQFGRAMRQLDIQIVPAFSPQAKGRVERLFGTLQDRLVKALRLANISSISPANAFLLNVFISQHNARFARPPASPQNAFRPLLKQQRLDSILAFHSPRVLQNDFTLQYRSRFFQLEPVQPCSLRPRMTLLVEHRLNDSICLRFKNHILNYHPIRKPVYQPWYSKPFKEPLLPKQGTLNYARSVQIAL